MSKNFSDFGVNLTGGGARGAYQAGVLKALQEILKEQGLVGKNNPFQYWSGVSAGSINVCFCAAGISDLDAAIARLTKLWTEIQPEKVYRTDFATVSKNGIRWMRDLTLGPLLKRKIAHSLLDTSPLWDLIGDNIDFSAIESGIKDGYIKGIACSAYSYRDNRIVTFLQGQPQVQWNKTRRYSTNTQINKEHVMASCAIPILFPAIQHENEYFADGSFRNTTPVSPLIHMGAKKILVIGVRGIDEIKPLKTMAEPGVAKIAGLILNALFFDTTEIDLERVNHLNEIVKAVHKDIQTKRSDYTVIDYHLIRPSRDVSQMAAAKSEHLPKMIDFLLSGLGPKNESAELASYILFVPEFTRDLIDLGYSDVQKQKDKLLRWIEN